jgi:hypothetical protein
VPANVKHHSTSRKDLHDTVSPLVCHLDGWAQAVEGLATEALEEAQVEAQVEEATETQGQPRWHLHLRADL